MHLLEKYSSLIETFQREHLKQDIFNYCLYAEEPFELETFKKVLRAYEIHVNIYLSFGLILRVLSHDGTTAYRYFHSCHNNGVVMQEDAFRIASDD